MLRLLPVLLLMAVTTLARADVENVYDFENLSQEQRFQKLTEELRCPKCQNQNIADSAAPIARDMREEVHRMIRSGASDDEIVDSLVARFGEFILYKPRVEKRTLLLWATPALAVFVGVLAVLVVVIRSRRSGNTEPALTAEEKARVEQILAESDQEPKA